MRVLPKSSTVPLLELDPDLAERVPVGAREEALRLTRARLLTLRRGELRVDELRGEHAALRGLLLLEGLLARSVRIGDTTSLQLLARGELVEVAGGPLASQLIPMETTWTVLEPVAAAAIDDDFLHETLRWPALAAALFERATAQSARAAARCAISQLPRVEDRVETLLWFLAERLGRIARDGVVVPLRLTHETIGQMIGAKRPTVSLALKALERDGAVERRDDGAWLLRRAPVPLTALEEEPGGGVRWAVSPADPVGDGAAPTQSRVSRLAGSGKAPNGRHQAAAAARR